MCVIKFHSFQYIPGHKSSNIILTAPHGGLTEEDSIPLRMAGCKGTKGKKGVSSDGCIYKVAQREFKTISNEIQNLNICIYTNVTLFQDP